VSECIGGQRWCCEERYTLEGDDVLQLAQLLLKLAGDDEERLQEGGAQECDPLLLAGERGAVKGPLEAIEVDLGRELDRQPSIGLERSQPHMIRCQLAGQCAKGDSGSSTWRSIWCLTWAECSLRPMATSTSDCLTSRRMRATGVSTKGLNS